MALPSHSSWALFIASVGACIVLPVESTECGSLKGCFLRNFDAPENADIPLSGVDIPSYSIGAHDSFSVRCDVEDSVDFVRFQYDGEVHTEYRMPYWMNGDILGWIHRADYLGTSCPERKSLQVTGHLWGEEEACFDETFDLFAECDGFDITLSLVDVDDELPFTDAAERWSEIVTGDLPPVIGFGDFVQPFDNCTFPMDVDDVEICGLLRPIDGPTVAFVGPDYLRADSNLPINGLMVIDSSATTSPFELRKAVLREMGHVLGIGTLWDTLRTTADPTTEERCSYNGTQAVAEFEKISGCSSGLIPLESGSGATGECTHWAHTCFTSELMTTTSNIGAAEPISQITAAALRDLGYEVTFDAADPITAADLAPSCRCDAGRQPQRRRGLSGWKQLDDQSPRRKLAAETETLVRNSARRFLQQRSVDERLLPESVRYVGDKVVIAYVEQDDTLYHVVVTR